MPVTLDALRRLAASHTLFPPTTLSRALRRFGFVQADPIRAPARAQDLVLRHRVAGYHAGDLERRYAKLGVAEDFFVNYGFVTPTLQALMHPRGDARVPADGPRRRWPAERAKKARLLLAFVQTRGEAHPREVDAHFGHGKVENYWGGSSNATTHLLDAMHYRGMLRVVRRERGVRIYAAHEHGDGPKDGVDQRARLDSLVDVVVWLYAPLPAPSLAYYVRRLRLAAPQWTDELRSALQRARGRLAQARVDGVDWYWPRADDLGRASDRTSDVVRLLTPFDPVVHDRRRFELLWGWVYRFEAYTPPRMRKLGYYALPLLWRERVIGWGNLELRDGALVPQLGYVTASPPRERVFHRELEAEIERVRVFLA